MYQYSFQLNNNQTVLVDLNTKDINDRKTLIYKGDSQNIKTVKEWLSLQTGVFGHLIGEATTPMDLDYVIKNAISSFKITKIKGDIIKSYNPKLSKDVLT